MVAPPAVNVAELPTQIVGVRLVIVTFNGPITTAVVTVDEHPSEEVPVTE